jgi:cytidine deaminase
VGDVAGIGDPSGQRYKRAGELECRPAMNDPATLIAAARAAAVYAYAPYSGFGVGAAVLLESGEVITGCNFENASYGLTLCAETVALATVNAQGKLAQVREIAVIGGTLGADGITGTDPVRPCGRCRQVINEAAGVSGHDTVIHCAAAQGPTAERYTIAALLPHAFGPDALK